MITYNFKLRRFQDSNGKIRSNLSGLLSSTSRKTLDPYKNKKESYKETLARLQIEPPHNAEIGDKKTKKIVRGKIYETGTEDDWSTDYDYVSNTELDSALYGYNPIEGADIFKRMRHNKRHRTAGKFMYNKPIELKKKYTNIVVFCQMRTDDKNTKQVWMLPMDFSFSGELTVKEIYNRIHTRTHFKTERERKAGKRRRRTKNFSLIERMQRFVVPAINSSNGLKTGKKTHWYLDRIVGFMQIEDRIKR